MGKYCDVCGVKEKDIKQMNGKIQNMHIIEYINGKCYSKHEGDVCPECREKILCGLDKLKTTG